SDDSRSEGDRGLSIVVAAIGFLISTALAVFSVAVADHVALWIRASFVLAAGFFAWLLFFAPAKLRIAITRLVSWF
ncbi:MAG TPA: hypothetical protein VFS24_13165, partial [Steroidobacteraceae bacterium]|nr:hypothetical protein [Steroidobacteraceae bacterium]